jgi:hypothetical protein
VTHRAFLNGTEVPIPKDLDRFEQEAKRDFEKRIIYTPYPGSFEFASGGYSVLREAFVADICDTVELKIYEVCGNAQYLLIRGEIVLADCKWDLQKCTVECSVQDDTISARINNNFRIPLSPGSNKSKNETAITEVAFSEIEFFDPQDAVDVYLPDVRYMFDWYECIKHAVQYLSDGTVTASSEWYEALENDKKIAIAKGFQVRTASAAQEATVLTYTFDKLWLEIARRYNLWMSISRDNAGNPHILIEQEDEMFPDEQAFELQHVEGLIQTIDAERLYSSVVVGDEKGLPNWGVEESLPFLMLQTFSEERFHFSGQCNRDVVLELSGQWICDTNVIERLVVLDTTSREYDKDVIIVQYNSYTMQAVKTDYLNPGSTPYLYNEDLLNVKILNRYTLPSSVGIFFDASTAGFRASSQETTQGITAQLDQPPNVFETEEYPFGTVITWPDETTLPNEDPGNNWDASFTYTAPAQGYYNFGWNIDWLSSHATFFGTFPAQAKLIMLIQRFDSGGNFIEQDRDHSSGRVTSGQSNFTGTLDFVLSAGDYVEFTLIREVTRLGPIGNSTVAIGLVPGHSVYTDFVAAGGGVITTADPLSPRVVRYEFERLIPVSQWMELLADPRLAVKISNTGGSTRTCHVLEASRESVRGRTKFTLIASKRQPL